MKKKFLITFYSFILLLSLNSITIASENDESFKTFLHKIANIHKEARFLKFVSNNRLLASYFSGDMELFEIENEKLISIKRFTPHMEHIYEFVFTKDKKYVLSVSDDKKIVITDLLTFKESKHFEDPDQYLTNIQISSD
ncbi:MAG: hypothetical protein ACK4IX_10370, partial [Candidatus Sericytochromatia bacterium]